MLNSLKTVFDLIILATIFTETALLFVSIDNSFVEFKSSEYSLVFSI